MTRRGFLLTSFLTLAAPEGTRAQSEARASSAAAYEVSAEDDLFLDELSQACFGYFIEGAHPESGQVLDRRRHSDSRETRRVASIAATGFGLTALCIADSRRWRPREALEEQVVRTLRHLRQSMPHDHGFFYHFHDWRTSERLWQCELSSIDTTLLLCGVLTCRAHFKNGEIRRLATEVYERVEWSWMLNGGQTFSMGWTPERGFLESRWDHYCELMMLPLMALGSPTHPVAAETWRAWSRPVRTYFGERYVWSPAPIFVHQFAHAWFDFRRRTDAGTDWFANSIAATRAHVAWSLAQAKRFPKWSGDLWGVTSSDSAKGYVAWGGPPDSGPLDGTIVSCAAAGSLPFLPEACLRTLRHQRAQYGTRAWGRFGFVDAFNPHNDWVNPDVIGIDVGITLLMAENLRSGFVWNTFMKDPAPRAGMKRAGFT
jgi:hypothetical protein